MAAELAAMQQKFVRPGGWPSGRPTRARSRKLAEFEAFFTPKNADNPEIHGGFAICHFVEGPKTTEILARHKVTIRCIPVADEPGFGEAEPGVCIFTGQPTTQRAVFAKAY